MTKWYVKDLSKLTGITVQTLHHYDRIGLLRPSLRLANGYRLYLESDLLRLEQIIALKFFGFPLSQIKGLLTGDAGSTQHFADQAKLLEEKANHLLVASNALKAIISEFNVDKSISWQTIIKLIEVYRMTKEVEQSWVKEVFTPEELTQYAEWKHSCTPAQNAQFDKDWAVLVADIAANSANDPQSIIGITIGERCMILINGLYGKKYAHLRTKKFPNGYGEGKGMAEVALTPAALSWLDQAIDAYAMDRVYKVVDQVGSIADEEVFQLWNEVLDDICGESSALKKAMYDMALADQKVSERGKEWLKTLRELITTNRHLL